MTKPKQTRSSRQRPRQAQRSPLGHSSAAPISPARSAAFRILLQVATTSAHADDLLHAPAVSALSPRDRNLATTLTMGVLRWQIALDARIASLLHRPDDVLPVPVSIALRLGAYQLLFLDRIPPHAALSESVEMVCAAHHSGAAAMVNAILRNLTRQLPAKARVYETVAAFAQRLGHPLWLVNRWVQNYGRAAALAICESGQREPAPSLLFPAVEGVEARSGGQILAEPGGSRPDATTAPLPLPRMDDGSRLVAELCAAAAGQGARSEPIRVWDTCAAPGGKTLVLLHRLPEAQLLASEANPRRVQGLASRLQDALRPDGSKLSTSFRVRTLHVDASRLPEREGLFHLILCDVPCSGTGTLGRNPEIRHRLQAEDLPRQASRQREILSAALSRLAPGGSLLYSTCSLEPEENEQVVSAVLASNPTITNPSLEPVFHNLVRDGILSSPPPNLIRNGCLRTLPGVNFQGDGFFAALLHRDPGLK